MRGETRIWFLSAFFLFPLLYAETEYECGAHGRFEYCVDGIPGCVVGCHCHPGYYFDTDSKICEHNSKLTKGAFRRYYNPEPTRIPDVEIITPPNKRVSTPSSTSNPVEEKIDEITKDADDLGDWLYNQFFKTIENQVINKTQDEESPSRRSGDQLNKPSRRSHHRSRRHKQKKKKSKSKSLKSKLLRITEDDSLFDSSSGSNSNSDGDSSASTGDSGGNSKSSEKKDDGHGHKKIVIFNKKPQPPLPSFIFLPNMDSSFYPPIGLPAPPMPMYPMVPVPPMMQGPQMGPPMFPYPGPPPPCEENSAAGGGSDSSTAGPTTTTEPATTTTTTKAPTTTAEPTIDGEPAPPPPDNMPPSDNVLPPEESDPSTEAPSALRSKPKKKKNKLAGSKNKIPRPALRDRRNKLLKRLQEKINRKNKLENYYMAEQYQDPNVPQDVPEAGFESKHNFMTPYMHEMLQEKPDVDFKYLADLIHKGDLNKTLDQHQQHHPIPSNSAIQNPKSIPDMVPMMEPIRPILNRRNNYQTQIVNQPRNNFSRFEPRTQLNDTFYTDLGKQIASMIRKIDTWGDREVNIEIEGANRPVPQSPVFNENNYASRSFWERSVRSPIRHFASFRNEIENIKRSNEDLFSLESKVEVAASTARTLSLYDLENIISIVQKRRTQAKRNSQKSDSSNTSFKLDLLPDNIKTNYDTKISKNIQTLSVQKTNNIHTTIPPNKQKQKKGMWFKKPIAKLVGNKKIIKDNMYSGLMPERKIRNNEYYLPRNWQQQVSPTFNAPLLNSFNSMSHLNSKLITQDVRPTRTVITTTPAMQVSYIAPSVAKRIQLNRRSNNNDFYTFHKNSYLFDDPMPIMQYTGVGLTKNILPNGRIERPSYFHHEFHHFDYIDK